MLTDFININIKEALNILNDTASVIRQNGESQNRCFKKIEHAKFSKKRTFPIPWYALFSCIQSKSLYSVWIQENSAYQGVRNVRFFENLAYFVFLKHPFWDSLFCLITDDWQKLIRFFIQWSFLSRTIVKSQRLFRTLFYMLI